MSFHRRDFLRTGLQASSLVAMGASTVPGFLSKTAARAGDAPGRGERVLVVIQLLGGNDGLNTVIPYKDAGYDKARRVLRINPGQQVKVNDELGLHPSLGGFDKILNSGRLAILQGIGYPNPDRSHFRSMEIWETARVDHDSDSLDTGWLGRAIDLERAGAASESIPALCLTGQGLPLALKSSRKSALAVQGLDQFRLGLSAGDEARQNEMAAMLGVAKNVGAGNSALDFVRRSTLAAYQSSQSLEQLLNEKGAGVEYPGSGLGQQLSSIARIIRAGFSTPIFYTTLDGFDTHANQLGAHAALLTELGDALTAFENDLREAGQADRVTTLVFSEFGRRVQENASSGTDHGAAASAFVVGPIARPGVVGAHPSFDDLDDGDLKHHTDFRRIYASLLQEWLGLDAVSVLGPGFDPLGLFA